MVPTSKAFDTMDGRRHQIQSKWWVGQDSPTKIGNVLHSLQIWYGALHDYAAREEVRIGTVSLVILQN